MLKRYLSMMVLLGISPFLVQCATQKEVQTLDLRVRNVDNRLVNMETEVQGSLQRIQKQLAQQSVALDRLKGDILQARGQLDESSRSYQMLRKESAVVKEQLAGTVGDISSKMTVLSEQVDETLSGLEEVKEQRLREETERVIREAKEAELAAAKAREQAAAKSGGPKKLEPRETKKKASEAVATTRAVVKPTVEQGLYGEAQTAFRAKEYKKAHSLFSQYLKKNPRGGKSAEARFYLGESLFNRGEFELSILEFQRVIDDYRGSVKAPIALLKQGLAFEKLNDRGTAKMVYYKLLDEFPKSNQATQARKRLDVLQ
jgi:tol-pal system protein YbgF